jgi:hypothetical protein
MLDQKQNVQQFIPALVLTPEQKKRLIEDKVKRAEQHLQKLKQLTKQLQQR